MARDLFVPIAVLGALACMLFPLPPALLDILLVANLLFGCFLLVNSLYLSDPLRLSSLPTMLLLATLVRLALNISTTRLILLRGDAGQAIEAFGKVVISGNILVGLVIFLVISIVQFIVIAKGSERVAEVSARFTLDALPGKQMAIDADVRAGLIDFEAARRKRDELQTESRFYGALDGTMKFIKGDAIAGLVIVAINAIGGILVGSLYHGLGVAEAVQRYTLLTVGDGLLSQIPALLNSLAAGMVVTHVGKDSGTPLARQVAVQLSRSPKVQRIVAALALILALIPGMPTVAFLLSAAVLLGTSLLQRPEREGGARRPVFVPRPPALIQLEVGERAGQLLLTLPDLPQRLERVRQQMYDRWGLILKTPELSANPTLADRWRLSVRGQKVREEPFGDDPAREIGAMLDAVRAAVDERPHEFIDDVVSRRMLDHFEADSPELVSAAVPGTVTLTQFTTLLRELLREGVAVRNLDLILQRVAETGTRAVNPRVLLQEVRIALGVRVLGEHLPTQGKLPVVTMESALDLACSDAEARGELPVREVVEAVTAALQPTALVIASAAARRALRDALVARGQFVPVVAYEELAEEIELEVVGEARCSSETARLELIERMAA